MTTSSLGAAATGTGVGGAPRSTLLAPSKKCKIKIIMTRGLTGDCAGGAEHAKKQKKTGDSERPGGGPLQEPEVVVVPALALPLPLRVQAVQEPVKPKRRRDFNSEMIWVSKKQSFAVAADRERGNAIAEANWAAAPATAFPLVQESAGNKNGGELIWKKARHSFEGRTGETVDEKKEGHLWPCEFAATVHGLDDLHHGWKVTALDTALQSWNVENPVDRDHHGNGEEDCWPIKSRCLPNAAVCEGSIDAVDQANTPVASTPSTVTQEQGSWSLPVQKAKAAGRGRQITEQPFRSLTSGLQCLGVTNVTPIVAKILTSTDARLDQSRLQVSPRELMDSPLLSMLTSDEVPKVYTKHGLWLEALDRHGRSYIMNFKYLGSVKAFRLKHEWTLFVKQNGVREGDLVELGAFHVDGRLVLTLLNYAMEGWIPEETEAADSLLMLSDSKQQEAC